MLLYIAIIGHHFTDPFWGNQATSPAATDPYASTVGQGGVAKITKTESNSNYNGPQAVYRQQLAAVLELTANYARSHSLTGDVGFYRVSNSIDQKKSPGMAADHCSGCDPL